MSMGHGPNNILRSKSRITAKKDLWKTRLKTLRIKPRHTPLIEINTCVGFNPGESVFLTDRNKHIVTGEELLGFTCRYQFAPTLVVKLSHDTIKAHPNQLAVFVDESRRNKIVEDRNTFMHRIFLLPGRGFHLLKARTNDDLYILTA